MKPEKKYGVEKLELFVLGVGKKYIGWMSEYLKISAMETVFLYLDTLLVNLEIFPRQNRELALEVLCGKRQLKYQLCVSKRLLVTQGRKGV